MVHACNLASRSVGFAEPNPPVGCVIGVGDSVVCEGWTQPYGGQHAEAHAISRTDDADLSAATLYVTLEPCCHHGKTPPCTDAILSTGIKRVVVAIEDPFPKVAGQGIAMLLAAGLDIRVGVARAEARRLLAPYMKLQTRAIPWVTAKWAMTLDGKIATSAASSQWISSPASRQVVHDLRGRVDAIMIGIGTAIADNPLLTARPAGARIATRIVVDSKARLPASSRLVETARDVPVILAVCTDADKTATDELEKRGVEVLRCRGIDHGERMDHLMLELGRRRMTNVLVEGGEKLLGGLFDRGQIDEVHAFIAPKLCGGQAALGPVGGHGIASMGNAIELKGIDWREVDGDLYVSGRISE